MKGIFLFITVCNCLLGLNCLALDVIQHKTPVYSHSFTGQDALNGWNSTSGVTATTGSEYLLLEAGNADSKIWTGVNLPKGRYSCKIVSGGDICVKVTLNSWQLLYSDKYLEDSRQGSDFRTYTLDFEAPGGDAFIVVQVAGSSGDSCKIESLDITPSINYTFVDKDYDYIQKNWYKTTDATLVPEYYGLKINAASWDSKIYRNDFTLQAQKYTISAIGKNVDIQLRTGWIGGSILAEMQLDDGKMNTKIVNVDIPADATYCIVAKTHGGSGTMGCIKGIRIKPVLNYTFDYTGCGTDGWNKTSGASLLENIDSLTVNAANWDSKIYRSIALPPDEYIITATVKGKTQLQLTRDWTTKILDKTVSVDTDQWYTQSYYIKTLNSNPMYLVLKVNGGSGESCELKNIRIEQAPVNLYLPPTGLRGWMQSVSADTANWQALAATGANFVRLQHFPTKRAQALGLNPDDMLDPLVFPDLLDDLEDAVEKAEAQNIKVVIDLHQAPFGPSTDCEHLWSLPDLTSNFCTYWAGVATRFKPYVENGTIIGYDLYNEPLDRDNSNLVALGWRDIAQQIINTIREIDKDVWVVFQAGPGGGDGALAYLKPLADYRVIYSHHFYEPRYYANQGLESSILGVVPDPSELKPYPNSTMGWDKSFLEQKLHVSELFQAKYQVPIYIGEFSSVKWAEGANIWFEDFIDVLEDRDWIWSVHAWREWAGWNHELNDLFYINGDAVDPLHILVPGETSLRLDAIETGFDLNP